MTGKLVEVDLRNGEYLVKSYSRTPAGYWVSPGLPSRLGVTASPGELGQAIRDALAESGDDAAMPSRDDSPARPMLDALGLRDYAEYMIGTRSVEVFTEPGDGGESVEVTPQRNDGPREGFTPMTDHITVFSYDSPGQLGVEVIRAFDKAR